MARSSGGLRTLAAVWLVVAGGSCAETERATPRTEAARAEVVPVTEPPPTVTREPPASADVPASPREPAPPVVPSPAIDVHLVDLTHAPFEVPGGAPHALVHAPAGALDEPGPVHVVLFLHGYTGCVLVLASDAPDARCTDDERRGHAGIERELGRVTIAAHSAAFETTIAIVRQGGLGERLRDVVLLDALYSGGPAFLGWAREGTEAAPRTLVSLHTGGGTTARRGAALGHDARAALGDAALLEPGAGLDALSSVRAPARVLVLRVPGAHGDVPRRFLGPVLRALVALPPS